MLVADVHRTLSRASTPAGSSSIPTGSGITVVDRGATSGTSRTPEPRRDPVDEQFPPGFHPVEPDERLPILDVQPLGSHGAR